MILSKVLVVGLAAFLVGCAGGSSTGPRSSDDSDDVLVSFSKAAREQTVPDPDRQEILRWWSPQIILGSVKYIKERDVYEIQFPDMSLEYEEEWGIDMKSSTIWPVNAGAYMTAVVLFCEDRNDYGADCQYWFRQLDALKQSVGN